MFRNKLKQLVAVLLAIAMIGSMAACGQEADDETTSDQPETSAVEPTETVTSTDTESDTSAETEGESADLSAETKGESTEPSAGAEGESTDESIEAETEAPTEALIAGLVPEGARVDSSYFDDVVFVGDSISLKLEYYEASMDVLGDAQFLTAGSLGSGNALWDVSEDSVHPSYNGEKMRLEDSVPLTGAKKLYIMLGMNDIAIHELDEAVQNLETLIDLILERTPDLKIFIQSMTPLISTSSILSSTGHNPQRIAEYNTALLKLCEERGWYFVDVASVLSDDEGFLPLEYCSDPDALGIHFSNEGCEIWVDYLYTHAVP